MDLLQKIRRKFYAQARQHLTLEDWVGHFPATTLPLVQSVEYLQVPPTAAQSASWYGALTSSLTPAVT
jgi:hypothetical protein